MRHAAIENLLLDLYTAAARRYSVRDDNIINVIQECYDR